VTRDWRYIVGTFQIEIPVELDEVLLPAEENILAILEWRLQQIASSDRWYPVLLRYVGDVLGRVEGFGGNPVSILPSPTGVPSPSRVHPPRGERETWIGRVSSIIYDRFGEFEGFDLETEHSERRFRATEHTIEELVRCAWLDRILIAVHAPLRDPHRPSSITLLRAPRRHVR
jgi:hypothetical protein